MPEASCDWISTLSGHADLLRNVLLPSLDKRQQSAPPDSLRRNVDDPRLVVHGALRDGSRMSATVARPRLVGGADSPSSSDSQKYFIRLALSYSNTLWSFPRAGTTPASPKQTVFVQVF